ncbi:hypothetical protein [Streptomyces sp. B15]|uniref:hypothetical protein n=1 Tax=Streptomyces sp. B15 TaxID=1537797 RepID=UPI001B37C00E|nr:hypothetical protein [Streptomyces sp. B15]MBQ1123752.1 hypothetical protein [Streptomyces sp. B15]
MRHHTGPTAPQPAADRLSPIPSTVWLPPADEPHPAPADDEVLPQWAIERIRTQIIPRPSEAPSPLLRVRVNEAGDSEGGSSLDARARTTTYPHTRPHEDGADLPLPPLLLAEFHPDTLRAPEDADQALLSDPLPAPQDVWPGFFHRAHRLLPAEGILLVATRQRRDERWLIDPLGELTASARIAGFSYLQHLVIAHLHPDSDHLAAARAEEVTAGGLIHSDLLLFSPRTFA